MKYTTKSIVSILEPTYLLVKEILSLEVKENKNPGLEAYPYFVCVNWDQATTYISDGKGLYRPVPNDEYYEKQHKEHEEIASTTTNKGEFIEKLGDKYIDYIDLKPVIVETEEGLLVGRVAEITKCFNLLSK